jgi:hypothetical protein
VTNCLAYYDPQFIIAVKRFKTQATVVYTWRLFRKVFRTSYDDSKVAVMRLIMFFMLVLVRSPPHHFDCKIVIVGMPTLKPERDREETDRKKKDNRER